MNNNLKYFSGQIKNEEIAARIYDRYSLQTMGLRAKTNFDYRRIDIYQIIQDIEEFIQNTSSDKNIICLKGTFNADRPRTPITKVILNE